MQLSIEFYKEENKLWDRTSHDTDQLLGLKEGHDENDTFSWLLPLLRLVFQPLRLAS